MSGRYSGSGLSGLGREIVRRTCAPWDNPTFWLGFVLNVLFGGWAIWFEIGLAVDGQPKHDLESIQLAFATFFPAVSGVTFIQVILEQNDDKRLMLSSVLLLAVILAFSTYLIFHADQFGFWRFVSLVCSFAATLWFWVMANCDAAMFADRLDSATGGDPRGPLSRGTKVGG